MKVLMQNSYLNFRNFLVLFNRKMIPGIGWETIELETKAAGL
jgi:hypothetical protein